MTGRINPYIEHKTIITELNRLLGDEADILTDGRFQLLLLPSLLITLDTTLVSPILDSLIGVFGVSTAEIGLLVTAAVAPPILLIPVGRIMADRYGRRPVLVLGTILFGSAGSAIAFTTDFRVALGLRAIQGVGFAFTLPVIITSIRDLYAEERSD